MTVITDPAYLTEPMVRTRDYVYQEKPADRRFILVEPVDEVIREKGTIPHHLRVRTLFLTSLPTRTNYPKKQPEGGAETLYPEYEQKLSGKK